MTDDDPKKYSTLIFSADEESQSLSPSSSDSKRRSSAGLWTRRRQRRVLCRYALLGSLILTLLGTGSLFATGRAPAVREKIGEHIAKIGEWDWWNSEKADAASDDDDIWGAETTTTIPLSPTSSMDDHLPATTSTPNPDSHLPSSTHSTTFDGPAILVNRGNRTTRFRGQSFSSTSLFFI